MDYVSFKDGAAGAQTSYFARNPSVSWEESQHLIHKENIIK